MADFYTSMNSPVGPLTIFETDGAIVALEWGRVPASRSSPLLNDATRQLTAYFDGHLETFDLPVAPAGSDFQHRVWQAMSEIPYGRTETYGELAQRIGGVGAFARALGVERDHGVDRRAQAFDAFEIMIERGAAAGLAGSDRARQRAGGQLMEFGHGHGVSVRGQRVILAGVAAPACAVPWRDGG